jgi:hypothetical protein
MNPILAMLYLISLAGFTVVIGLLLLLELFAFVALLWIAYKKRNDKGMPNGNP